MKKISIIGAGSWGTTLAVLIAENGYKVTLWSKEKSNVESIIKHRENKHYLPGIKIPGSVSIKNSIEEVAADADIIINAVPSQFTRDMAKRYSKNVNCDIIVNTAKGIEIGTYRRMSEVLREEIPNVSIASLFRPQNHAEEVSMKMPTATVIASQDVNALKDIKKIFHTDYFRVFTHDDIIGVEVCGALKNIAALATGACGGLGYGDNSRASIITLGLMEMSTYGQIRWGLKGQRFTALPVLAT